ncbi:MAG TPA: glycosyltransferase, partial [Thermoanaerobaculia bacterium]|nr:glycosyltransferase [Thermoanaerobaculia bacterium]
IRVHQELAQVQQQIESLVAKGLEVRTLHLDRKGLGMQVYLETSARVREEMRNWRPDVIHTMYGGLMGWLVSRAAVGVPIVQAFCGSDLNGDVSGPLSLRSRAWLGVMMSRWTLTSVHHVIVKSARLRDELPGWLPGDVVSVVPNGVNLDRFRPLDHEACLLALGWPAGRFHVVIATPSLDDSNKRVGLARAAVSLLRGRGVDAELHTMTDVCHEDVPIWLNAADAVVMTSVQEGSPNIVKEALACNRPVVSVDVGDVAERIASVSGCHLVGSDAEAVATGLEAVSRGRGTAAGRDAVRELSLERVADRLVEIYERVVRAETGGVESTTRQVVADA